MRADLHEVDVQALAAMTVLTAQTTALKVFEVYPPTVLLGRIGREFMPGAGRSVADSRNVLSDLCGKIAYAVRVPRLILNDGTSFGNRRKFTDKQKAKSRQQGSGHLTLLATDPNHSRLLIAGRHHPYGLVRRWPTGCGVLVSDGEGVEQVREGRGAKASPPS